MKHPLVFSFVKEQRTFLTALIALLSFLAVLCLGLVISLGTAVGRWNAQWDLMATVQVMPGTDISIAQKILDGARDNIVQSREIGADESARMLSAWLSGGNALTQYIPKMIEVKFKNRTALKEVREKIAGTEGVRIVTFADGMRAATSAGWQIMLLSVFVLGLVLGALVLCVSYITRNITLIHRRELEILNQIGARDGFIARQLMVIIARLGAIGAFAGLITAVPVLLIIISMARGMRVGMFTQMAIPGAGWILLCGLAVSTIVLAIWVTRRTVMGILRK